MIFFSFTQYIISPRIWTGVYCETLLHRARGHLKVLRIDEYLSASIRRKILDVIIQYLRLLMSNRMFWQIMQCNVKPALNAKGDNTCGSERSLFHSRLAVVIYCHVFSENDCCSVFWVVWYTLVQVYFCWCCGIDATSQRRNVRASEFLNIRLTMCNRLSCRLRASNKRRGKMRFSRDRSRTKKKKQTNNTRRTIYVYTRVFYSAGGVQSAPRNDKRSVLGSRRDSSSTHVAAAPRLHQPQHDLCVKDSHRPESGCPRHF